jgi:acyl carrier protein
MGSTRDAVRDFILKELLEDPDPGELDDATPLVATGILDSLATLKLITFLEEEFGVAIAPDEADEEHLNTIADIVRLVQSKLGTP